MATTPDAKMSEPASERELVTTRVFDAPRDLVFKAWTDPKQMAQWFPPKDFTAPVCELDVRPGGAIRIHMRGPDGSVFPGKGVFREVVPSERLVFTFEGEGPQRIPPLVLMTVVFEAQGARTKLTITHRFETVEDLEAMRGPTNEGLGQSLDKLAALLGRGGSATTTEIRGRTLTLTRVFEAPRELVFQAYTEPKHIVKWAFANDWESPYAETDVRPGGKFRIGMRPADHSQEGFAFEGTYREVAVPERIVQVLGDGRVITTTFANEQGKTKLTLTVEMEMSEEQERQGWSQILEHFAQHLATLR